MPTNDSDDVDLYGDLPEFNLEDTIQKLEAENKKLTQTVKDLTSRVSELETQNNDLSRMNKNLKANISSLVKTVQGEIQRKDNTIAELRQEREDLFFRRQKPNGRGRPALKSQNAEAVEKSTKPDGSNAKEERRRSTRQSASSADPFKRRESLSEEPTQTSPQKTLRSNRRKGDPAKADRAKADPAMADPAMADPAMVDPAKADPTKADSAKADPTKADSAKAVPAKADPAKAVPAKAVPAKAVPAKAVPAKAVPAKAAAVYRLTPLAAQTNSLDDFKLKRPRRTASVEQAQESSESKLKVAENAANTPQTPQNAQAKEEVSSASPKKRARRTPTSRLYVKTRSSARISAKRHSSTQETSTDNADVSLLEALQLEERSQPAFTNSPLPDMLSPFKDDRSRSPVSMPSAISTLLTGALKPVEPSTPAANPSTSTSTFGSIASLLTGALKPNQSSVSGGTPAPSATPALPEVGSLPGSTPVTQVLRPVEPREDTSSMIPKDPRKLPSACDKEKVVRLGVLSYKADPPPKGPQDVGDKKDVLREDGLVADANERDVPRREAIARRKEMKQKCGKEEERRETPEDGVSREIPRKGEAQGTLQGGMARREEQKRGEEKQVRSERETLSKDKVLRKEEVTRREENLRRDEERGKEEAKLREEQHRKEESTRREEMLRKEEERRREEAKRREETVRKEEEQRKEEVKRREEERRKEEARRREEQHRKEEIKHKEEKHRIEEAKRKEEERRKEEAKRREEQHRREEERRKEEARKREEQRRKEEERWEEEAKRREDIRKEEERRKEEARRREEQHQKEEAKRIEEKHRIEEAKRKEEETRRKEEMARKEDLSGKSDTIPREARVSSSETRAKEASANQMNSVPDANKNGCLPTQTVSSQNDSGVGSKPRISLGATQSDSSALQCDFRVRRRTRVQVKMIVNTPTRTPSCSGEAGTSPAVLASPTNKVANDNRLGIVDKSGLSKVVEKALPITSQVVEKALPVAATEVPGKIIDHSPRDRRYSRGSNEASPRQLPYKRPVSDFRHRGRSRSRSRSPPRSRENLPPGRPDHRHSKGFRSPPRHRLSRKHDPRTHHLNFTRRSRSLSPRLCLQRRKQRKEEQRLPPKLPIDRKERERMLFGKSPDRSPRAPPQPRIITVVNVKRSRKANFQDSPDTSEFRSSHKPQGSTAANRLLSTPVYFRERHPDSNPGESDSESGAISSGTESSHSKDSDDSYRPKKRRRPGFDHAKRKSKKLCRGENR